jgi:hypothetical protein
MVDVLDREIQLVRMPVGLAAVLRPAVREPPRERNPVLIKKGHDPIVERIGRGDGGFLRIEFRKAHLRVRVDPRLLVNPADALQRPDVEGSCHLLWRLSDDILTIPSDGVLGREGVLAI